MIKSYVNSWVRKKILNKEVKTNIQSDQQIDGLVNDYKMSLLLDKFEKNMVSELLDTVVNNGELINYYNLNKDHFKLADPIFRIRFVALDATLPKIDQFYGWWKDENKAKVESFCNSESNNHILDENKWHELSFLKSLMPPDLFEDSSFTTGRSLQKNRDGVEYFLKVVEKTDKFGFAPLEYVKEDVENIILQKRKLDLLSSWKEKLFEKEFLNDNVKIYL